MKLRTSVYLTIAFAPFSIHLPTRNNVYENSHCRAWFAHHGYAIFDSHLAVGARQLHVWNNVHAAVIVYPCQNCVPATHAALCVYWGIDGCSHFRQEE